MWNKNGWFHITVAIVPLFYQARLVAAGLRKEVRVCPSPLSPSLKKGKAINLKFSPILSISNARYNIFYNGNTNLKNSYKNIKPS